MSTEVISGPVAVTTAETVVATTTKNHQRAAVQIQSTSALIPGTRFSIYGINGATKWKIASAVVAAATGAIGLLLLQNVDVSGASTIECRAAGVLGNIASVNFALVGYDPAEAVTQAGAAAPITLGADETDVATLASLNPVVSASVDPTATGANATGSMWRLYSTSGGFRTLVAATILGASQTQQGAVQVVGDPKTQDLFGQVTLGATSFVLTAQQPSGKPGTAAIQAGVSATGAGGGEGGSSSGNFWPYLTKLAATIVAPLLVQAAAASDVVPQNLQIGAQGAFAGATVNQNGGDLEIICAPPATGGGAHGNVVVFSDAAAIFTIQGNGNIQVPNSIFVGSVECYYAPTAQSGAAKISAYADGVGGTPPADNENGATVKLVYNQTYNSVFVKPGIGGPATGYVPLAQLTADGLLVFDPNFANGGIEFFTSPNVAQSGFLRVGQVAATGIAQNILMARSAANDVDWRLIAINAAGTTEFGDVRLGNTEFIGGASADLNFQDGSHIILAYNAGVGGFYCVSYATQKFLFEMVGGGPLYFSDNSGTGGLTAYTFTMGALDATVASFATNAIQLDFATSASATAGGGAVIPATVAKFATVVIPGDGTYKFPLYAV